MIKDFERIIAGDGRIFYRTWVEIFFIRVIFKDGNHEDSESFESFQIARDAKTEREKGEQDFIEIKVMGYPQYFDRYI